MKQALIILTDGFEEMESVAPIDLLRRAEVNVTVASSGDKLQVTGRNGIGLVADSRLVDVLEAEYDLVVIPGGPGHKTLKEDSRVLDLLRKQAEAGRWIGSICAGPTVLHEAGLLEGKRYTAHFTVDEILPQRDQASAVVQDGNIITSQGAGTATRFGLALVEALCGREASDRVAASICH